MEEKVIISYSLLQKIEANFCLHTARNKSIYIFQKQFLLEKLSTKDGVYPKKLLYEIDKEFGGHRVIDSISYTICIWP